MEFVDKEKEREITQAWVNMSDDFYNMCASDEELVKIHNELEKIYFITHYNIEDDYTSYAYTANEGIEEDMEDIYEFDKKLYKEAKEISENIDQIKSDINKKINDLRNKRFAFLTNSRIEKLEKKLQEKENIAKAYSNSLAKENLKRHYLDNQDTLITPLREQYQEKLTQYAKVVVKKYIESNPNILARENKTIYSSSEHLISFDAEILNSVFNKARQQIISNTKTITKR